MKPKTILVVDDDPVVCRALEQQLLEEGYKVRTVTSGMEAFSLCKKRDFKLAYVNLIMDPMDGIETTKKLKAIAPHMKVVLMSGHREEFQARLTEFLKTGGCEAILEKPIVIDIASFTRRFFE